MKYCQQKVIFKSQIYVSKPKEYFRWSLSSAIDCFTLVFLPSCLSEGWHRLLTDGAVLKACRHLSRGCTNVYLFPGAVSGGYLWHEFSESATLPSPLERYFLMNLRHVNVDGETATTWPVLQYLIAAFNGFFFFIFLVSLTLLMLRGLDFIWSLLILSVKLWCGLSCRANNM